MLLYGVKFLKQMFRIDLYEEQSSGHKHSNICAEKNKQESKNMTTDFLHHIPFQKNDRFALVL